MCVPTGGTVRVSRTAAYRRYMNTGLKWQVQTTEAKQVFANIKNIQLCTRSVLVITNLGSYLHSHIWFSDYIFNHTTKNEQ